MNYVRFIYVSPAAPIHKVIGFPVVKATGGIYAHVSVELEGLLKVDEQYKIFARQLEALGFGVQWSHHGKYEDERTKEIHEFILSDDQFAAAVQEAKRLYGKHYGFDDCAIGGVHDVISRLISGEVGDEVSAKLASILDCNDAIDCSGVGTSIARVVWPVVYILDGHLPSQITPEVLRLATGGIPGVKVYAFQEQEAMEMGVCYTPEVR